MHNKGYFKGSTAAIGKIGMSGKIPEWYDKEDFKSIHSTRSTKLCQGISQDENGHPRNQIELNSKTEYYAKRDSNRR